MLYYIYIIRRGPKKYAQPKVRINEGIRSNEVRLIDNDGENLGVVPIKKALQKAQQLNLDLVEVSAAAKPPVAMIADSGKYQYEQNKLKKKWNEKDKEKGKKRVDETKNVQIKPGTGIDILNMRAKKIREWLDDGNSVQVTLFLFGRYKSMDADFLKDRLNNFIKTIPGEYKIIDEIKKNPKGFGTLIKPIN